MSIDPRKHLGLGPLKKPLFGHNRSHALNATQKISKPNVQKRKTLKTNYIDFYLSPF